MSRTRKLCFSSRHPAFPTLYCVFLTIFLFAFCCIKGNTSFRFDAATYWDLGSSFWNPSFSLYNYPQTLRGYALPLLLGFGSRLSSVMFGNPYFFYWLTYSICTVLLIACLLPSLFTIDFFSYRYIFGSFLCVVLFLYFWSDLLITPLSDIPGLTAYVGVVFFLKQFSLPNIRRFPRCLTSFFAGLLSYIAIIFGQFTYILFCFYGQSRLYIIFTTSIGVLWFSAYLPCWDLLLWQFLRLLSIIISTAYTVPLYLHRLSAITIFLFPNLLWEYVFPVMKPTLEAPNIFRKQVCIS